MPLEAARMEPPNLRRLGLGWDNDLFGISDQVKFIRSVDWASTDLGPPSEWPEQLTQAVDFVLADPTPAAVMWGERLTVSSSLCW
jgi:hypothetical protein